MNYIFEETVLLTILVEEPICGSQLYRKLSERGLKVSDDFVYNRVHKWLIEGLIYRGRARKLYITDKGKERLVICKCIVQSVF
jgi:DNA-binding PadR family transcriptional regulator